MSRTDRNWPQGPQICSRCGQEFKQVASLASHTLVCPGRQRQRKHPGYPPHFQKFLDEQAKQEAATD